MSWSVNQDLAAVWCSLGLVVMDTVSLGHCLTNFIEVEVVVTVAY